MGNNIGGVHINKQSLERFDKLLDEVQKVHKVEFRHTVVKNGARDLVLSLVAVTPMADFKQLRTTHARRGRGFAKAGWGVSMVGLGKMPRSALFAPSGNRPANWVKFGSFQSNLNNKDRPHVIMGNTIPYIEEMAGSSSIVPMAYEHASNKIEMRLNKHAARIRRKFA